jgi:hypothetical protein
MSSISVFSRIAAVLLAVLGWLLKSVFDRLMALLIPAIPKDSRLDKSTRWLRGLLLSRQASAPPSNDLHGAIESVSSLIEIPPHPGIGSFSSFNGTVTEFIISRRSLSINSTLNLSLLGALIALIILGIVMVSELINLADVVRSRWLENSPPWVQIIPGLILLLAIFAMFALFAFLISKLGAFFPRVAARLFPPEISLRTVFLSTTGSGDHRRLMISGGNYLPQEISRATLFVSRHAETLRFYNLIGKTVRKIRLRSISQRIFQVLGETVSLRALIKQLVQWHDLPITILDRTAVHDQLGAASSKSLDVSAVSTIA